MDIVPLLIVLAFGAVFGAIGGLLALKVRSPRAKSAVSAIMVALGVLIAGQLNIARHAAALNDFSLSDLADEQPFYRALIETDPAAARRIEDFIRQELSKEDVDMDTAIDASRTMVMSIIAERMVSAPEHLQKKAGRMSNDLFEHLKEHYPDICRKLALGERVGSLGPYMPDGMAEREQAYMVGVLQADPVDNATGDAARGEQRAGEIAQKYMSELSDGSSLTDEQWCEVTIRLNDTKLSDDDQTRRDMFAFEAALTSQ